MSVPDATIGCAEIFGEAKARLRSGAERTPVREHRTGRSNAGIAEKIGANDAVAEEHP